MLTVAVGTVDDGVVVWRNDLERIIGRMIVILLVLAAGIAIDFRQ
jgi:hypothetical protein